MPDTSFQQQELDRLMAKAVLVYTKDNRSEEELRKGVLQEARYACAESPHLTLDDFMEVTATLGNYRINSVMAFFPDPQDAARAIALYNELVGHPAHEEALKKPYGPMVVLPKYSGKGAITLGYKLNQQINGQDMYQYTHTILMGARSGRNEMPLSDVNDWMMKAANCTPLNPVSIEEMEKGGVHIGPALLIDNNTAVPDEADKFAHQYRDKAKVFLEYDCTTSYFAKVIEAVKQLRSRAKE